MLNKSLFSRSALGALVLAAAAALPAVAQAHDNDYRDYGRQDRYYDRYDQRWAQRPYWEREHAYWYWRNMHDRRFDAEVLNDIVVQHFHASRRDGAHGELGVPGDSQLSDDKDVQRYAKVHRHLMRHGDAAPRQRQHEDLRSICVLGETGGKLTPGINTVQEAHERMRRSGRDTIAVQEPFPPRIEGS